MSKKSKKKLQQLINKKRQIEQITSRAGRGSMVGFTALSPAVVASPDPETAVIAEAESPGRRSDIPTRVPEPAQTSGIGHTRELKRTAVSLAAILILLAVAIIIDRQSNYAGPFGDWLYNVLRLAS